jgi:Uma2 family endonuclease
MNLNPRMGYLTFADFCAMVPDGQKGDLISGVIYLSSPDNTDADRIETWLMAVLGGFVRRRKLGRIFGSRVAFRLDDKNSPEPDLSFVRTNRLHLVQRGFVDGPPDLAIEIVSPDSIERDYEKKWTQYEQAGVPEYWIVDEIEQKDVLLRLSKEGELRAVRPRKGELHFRSVPGFWVRPEWLWQDPMPDPDEVLKQILGE